VVKDHEEAGTWFFKAEEQGYAKSYYLLGVMFENGKGILKDKVQELKWFILAANKTDGDLRIRSAERRDELRGKMTRSQIAKAENLATDWKPSKTLASGAILASQ
jgi:TPR repeat protein